MAEKLMYIPNANTQNCPFYKLQLVIETFGHSTNQPTNQNSIKVPQIVRKRYFVNLGTIIINSPLSPPSLHIHTENK